MNANPVFSLHIPTKILFGCGELKKVGDKKSYPARKPDCHLVRNLHEEIRLPRQSR